MNIVNMITLVKRNNGTNNDFLNINFIFLVIFNDKEYGRTFILRCKYFGTFLFTTSIETFSSAFLIQFLR